jgi:tetratricopeptide (TPR) repeat protein
MAGITSPSADAMHQAPPLDESSREALRQAAAALDAAEAGGQAHAVSHALAQVAACYRGLRAMASAETCYEAALRWARSAGSTDQVVDLLCALCETAADLAGAQEGQRRGRGRAARERARDHAFEAATLAGKVADPCWEATVLLRISDVLDRCGDHDDAALLQVRALRLMSGSLSTGGADPSQLPSLGRLADG